MTAETLLHELQSPACYPDAPATVQILQTHLSVVCLAGDLVYKLKKAVHLPFVDFSTLAVRRATCREEVRLNRRLCPDTYLGCASLRRRSGALRFAATGDDEGEDDLDVAVVMRRLPAERMLDVLVRERAVGADEIEGLARHVAAFHARADRGPTVLAAGDPARLAGFAAANFRELRTIVDHGLPVALLDKLEAATTRRFSALLAVLRARAARGLVVDGHGDLHARNVCMTVPPTVYDCIEFEPAFRCGDVATDNAFLAMDLRYRGAPNLAAAYTRAYVAASGDLQQPTVLPDLVAYRAMVRAKVAAFAAAQPELDAVDRAAARQSALRHLMLAAAVLAETAGPAWLVVCGPPASGKSRLCTTLAEVAQWPRIATDIVRKELAGIRPTERGPASIYTPDFTRRTYEAVRTRARTATVEGARVVTLDGNFPVPELRAAAAEAARDAGAGILIVHVDVAADVAARRAEARARDPSSVSDAGPEQLKALRERFVAPTSAEGSPMIRVDGGGHVDDAVARVLTTLLDRIGS